MSANNNNKLGKIVIIGFVTAIVVLAGWLAVSLFSGTASHDPRGAIDIEIPSDAAPGTRGPGADAPSTTEPLPSERPPAADGGMADEAEIERIREQARAATLAANDGNEPIPCENVCDCPQGWSCQMGSQLCIPWRAPNEYCCDDEHCPAGQLCVNPEGGAEFCPEL